MKQLKSIVIFTIIIFLLILPLNISLAVDIDTSDYNPDNLTTNSDSIILIDAKQVIFYIQKMLMRKNIPRVQPN